MADTPELSVTVAIVSDTTGPRVDPARLASCLDALNNQLGAPRMEIIVGHLPDLEGLDALKARYPDVKFVAAHGVKGPRETGGGREHHDVLRALAMAEARGEIIALIEDHAQPDEHWCANIMKAHRGPDACVGGAMGNLVDKPLNWAVYFCDYGKYQNPLPEGEAHFATDSNVSYKRAALEKVPETWKEAFREVIVNGVLRSIGETITLRRDIIVNQNRTGLKFGAALRERYIWGRSYSATRNATLTLPKRILLAAVSPLLPVVLTLRLAGVAHARRIYFGKFLTALPLIVILLISWSLGEGVGYIAGVRRA